MTQSDTIAALATAPGEGGIAIVRLSGDEAYTIAGALLEKPYNQTQRPLASTFCYAPLYHENHRCIDKAIVLFFHAPRSYTGEDVVEFQVHGGRRVAQSVLERLWSLGARPAEPGEFTKRAFLNGRMDLTQAEAVSDLIAAKSPRMEQAARAGLEGHLSQTLTPIYQTLLTLSSTIEHLLDFEEGELPDTFEKDTLTSLLNVSDQCHALLATWHEGKLVREGALVVIAGKPNAGKSSLLNLLLGYHRAIVSQEAGTTRDSIEETFLLNGIPIRLTDTAGLRDTACEIEAEGVSRAKSLLQQADVLLYLIASNEQDTPPAGALVIHTKGDLDATSKNAISILKQPMEARAYVCQQLQEALKIGQENPVAQIANQRQYAELQNATQALSEACQTLRQGDIGFVPTAQQLRIAADAIGRILGRTYTDDLLDRVFSSFCVGK